MRTRPLRTLCFIMLLVAGTLAPATAHPLGNFTINHLSILQVKQTRTDIRYVLDEAEIPTFQEIRSKSASGSFTPAELRHWATEESDTILPNLKYQVDGRIEPLVVDHVAARLRPGAGGLPTLYWTADMHAIGVGVGQSMRYDDSTFAGRLGWRDVIVRPATEPTHELQAYPSALVGSPRDVTSTQIGNASTGAPVAAGTAVGAVSTARSNQLSDLLSRGTSDWRIVILTLLVAVGLGALHALEPGHGKTLLAVSLVGARATPKQALILAASLTFAHTIGVIALGCVILIGARYIVPETIYPWITLGSGAVVAILGAQALAKFMARRRLRKHLTTGASLMEAHELASSAESSEHAHLHTHGHGHGHGHGHDHDDLDDEAHARMHLQTMDGPLNFRGVVLAAMSGGIAPCPAALVVLLTALSLHQPFYGLIVIIAFSVGLAGLLTGLGIAVVRGASWLSNRPEFDRLTKVGPLLSAIVITVVGSAMLGQGFVESGVQTSGFAVSALVLAAIAGYALFPHAHGAHHHHDGHAHHAHGVTEAETS